jgi:hypothetical protein
MSFMFGVAKHAILLSCEIDYEAHWSDPFRSTIGHPHFADDLSQETNRVEGIKRELKFFS